MRIPFSWLIVATSFTLLTSVAGLAGPLYKLVHKDGSVTYTDRPVPGAERVDLSTVNQASMPSLAPKAATDNSKRSKLVQNALPDYQLRFVSPAEGETIRNNLGTMTVSAKLTPQAGGTYQLYLDGGLIQSAAAPYFQLEGIDRGEHRIQMRFRHNSGKVLASTEERVVYLHRNSVLINAN